MVLLLTMVMLSALSAMGLSGVMSASTNVEISKNERQSVEALYLAESAIHRTSGEYLNNFTRYSSGDSPADIGLPVVKPTTANLGTNGAYWIPTLTYGPGAPPAYVDVIAQGGIIGTNIQTTVSVRLTPTFFNPFMYGAFGDEGVSLTGNGTFDSYNSCDGPYDVNNNVGTEGGVGTNATGFGVIELDGNAAVNGDATVGPGGNVSDIDDSSNNGITGTLSVAGTLQDMTPLTDPGCSTDETLVVNGNGAKTFTAGTYQLPAISIDGNANIDVFGDVTFCVAGNVNTAGNAVLTINPGASLTMYVGGNITLSGNGIVNAGQGPEDFLIYGTATTSSITIAGNGNMHGAIHAPEADISVTGNGDIYGSVIGDTVTVTGNGDIHFDECLVNATTASTPSSFAISNWHNPA